MSRTEELTSAAQGEYVARVAGLTTEPAIYGRPIQFLAGRTGAGRGPSAVRVTGELPRQALYPAELNEEVLVPKGSFLAIGHVIFLTPPTRVP